MIDKTHQEVQTADQLFAMPSDGNRYELVQGTLRMMSPAGSEHGNVCGGWKLAVDDVFQLTK